MTTVVYDSLMHTPSNKV